MPEQTAPRPQHFSVSGDGQIQRSVLATPRLTGPRSSGMVLRHGPRTRSSDIVLRHGHQTWSPDMVLRRGPRTRSSDMVLIHGPRTWSSAMVIRTGHQTRSLDVVLRPAPQTRSSDTVLGRGPRLWSSAVPSERLAAAAYPHRGRVAGCSLRHKPAPGGGAVWRAPARSTPRTLAASPAGRAPRARTPSGRQGRAAC